MYMNRQSRTRFVATWLLLAGIICAQRAHSGTFQVDPIRITLTAQSTSALLTVRNESTEKTRFQIELFEWDENRDGQMVLKPSDDLVYYPNLLTVDPGDERKIRIGIAKFSATVKELAYRIFIEELPPVDPQESSGIRILTKMGVPIFVQPDKPVVKANIENTVMRAGELFFELRNNGNVHFFPRAIEVKTRGNDGDQVLRQDLKSWYVLVDGSREYRVKIPPTDCAKIKELEIDIQIEEKSLTHQMRVPATACNP